VQQTTTSSSDAWEKEYASGGIPSSVRRQPSVVVRDFLQRAKSMGVTNGKALDIGCGSGRNSLYLADNGFDVVAFDFAASQIDGLNAFIAENAGLKNRVHPFVHDIRNPWPVETGSIDLAIDTFCFKHQIEESAIAFYVSEVSRALRAGGLFMMSFAGRRDGYYALFPSDDTEPGQAFVDPGNQIASRLYDVAEVENIFSAFKTVYAEEKNQTNEMHGKIYQRETFSLCLQK
jgi:SAM-dependent methyltransferase